MTPSTRILVYALPLLASAFLLFWIQPLMAKQVVPLLGGAPGVWNTLLLFFQALLLAGYLYSHLLDRIVPPARQGVVHACVLVVSLAALPAGLDAGAAATVPTQSAWPFGWLFAAAAASVGAPFFMLATTAPLMQRWYARVAGDRDPYVLYAVSNAGSFMALLLFPFLLEPFFGVKGQLSAWSWAYAAFGLSLLVPVWRTRAFTKTQAAKKSSDKIGWKTQLTWFAFAFIPSSLLHGVSVFITTDIAAIPLLWIVPLALYLLSFVIPFARGARLDTERLRRFVLPLTAFTLILPFWVPITDSITHIFLHLGMVFLLSLGCHAELRRRCPDAGDMTLFYLWVAVGGVTGGFVNVIAAPLVFDMIAEYPLSIALACFALLPAGVDKGRAAKLSTVLDIVVPVATGAVLVVIYGLRADTGNYMARELCLVLLTCIAGAAALNAARHRLRFALLALSFVVAAGMTTLNTLYDLGVFGPRGEDRLVFVDRNFYGVIRVIHNARHNQHIYYNGTVMHAAQNLDGQNVSPAYFLYRLLRQDGIRELPVAIIGMGPGQMLQYSTPENRFEFFELNPVVPMVAQDPALFTFAEDYPVASLDVHIGDGRLNLSRQEDGKYGLIVSTAFNSNTIPFHLLTREALEMYFEKLAPGGVVLFIAPANFFDFTRLFATFGRELGLEIHYKQVNSRYKRAVTWFALRKTDETGVFGDLPWNTSRGDWKKLQPGSDARIWTDDYYNLPAVLKAPERNVRD